MATFSQRKGLRLGPQLHGGAHRVRVRKARWGQGARGGPGGARARKCGGGFRVFTLLQGTSTVLVPRRFGPSWVLQTSGLQEAGKRPGSTNIPRFGASGLGWFRGSEFYGFGVYRVSGLGLRLQGNDVWLRAFGGRAGRGVGGGPRRWAVY